MKLLETYALSVGLKINKPYIYQKYFPIPFENFICIHAGGGMPAKLYEYYDVVVELISPYLRESNIQIIQLGGNDDPSVKGAVDFRGKTSIHQSAYILSKSLMLLGNDSCLMHIAGSLDIPIVELFGSTSEKNHSPYFFLKGKTAFLQGDLKNQKHSFAREEADKVINRIKPEVVAQAIYSIFEESYELTRESIYFGKNYNHFQIDIIPNNILSPAIFQGLIPTIRMDLEFNEQFLIANLQQRKCNIITNKNINLDILKGLRQNIGFIIYELNEDNDPIFAQKVKETAIPLILYTEKVDQVKDLKLEYMDIGLIQEAQKSGKELIKKYPQINENTKYKTNKFLLGNQKIYLNKRRYLEGKNIENYTDNVDVISYDAEFLNYADNFYIFNENI